MASNHPNTDQNKTTRSLINPKKFKIFIFQPEESFFTSSFEERLKILESRVLLAKKKMQEDVLEEKDVDKIEKNKEVKMGWFQNKKNKLGKWLSREEQSKPVSPSERQPAPPSAIFVAPEYLFKDFSELCYQRYYTQQQKNEFKNKLKELSLNTDMLIVPGTMCWRKKAKADQSTYYRNTAYFFYHGEVQKYKKKNPHTHYDFDYVDEGFLGYMDLRRNYFKTGQDAPVKDFLGIKIGSEICFDSVQGELFHFIKENKVILDMQLILADGAKGATPVEQEGVLFIKVEKIRKKLKLAS